MKKPRVFREAVVFQADNQKVFLCERINGKDRFQTIWLSQFPGTPCVLFRDYGKPFMLFYDKGGRRCECELASSVTHCSLRHGVTLAKPLIFTGEYHGWTVAVNTFGKVYEAKTHMFRDFTVMVDGVEYILHI